jgi:hypothetical protein
MKALDQGLLLSVAKFIHFLEPGTFGLDVTPVVALLQVLARHAVYRGISLRLSKSLQRIKVLQLDSKLREISSNMDDRDRVLKVWESLENRITFEGEICYAGPRTNSSRILCSNEKVCRHVALK